MTITTPKVWALINTTSYELADNLTLKNILGYIKSSGFTADAVDGDGLLANRIDIPLAPHIRRNRQLTDEVQLQGSAFDKAFSYTVGALYDRTRSPGSLTDIPSVSLVVIGSPFAPSSLRYTARYQQNRITSKALYASGSYKITDQVTVNAGYRHTWEDVFAKQGAAGPSATLPTDPLASNLTSLSRKFEGSTYNADVSWKLSNENMIYGGYRHGYKRGGFNGSIPNPALAAFDGEKVDNFSIGTKNSFYLGGVRARFNVEAFYDRYKGQQVSYLTLLSAGIAAPTINVPRTDYWGADMDFVVNPTEWLDLSGNYTWMKAKNKNWIDNSVAGSMIDLAQNRVVFSPRNKYSISARFHSELPNNIGELALSPTLSHQDISYVAPFNTVLPLANQIITGLITTGAPTPVNFNASLFGAAAIPAYSVWDLRLELNHVGGSNFDIAAQVTNVGNKYYLAGVSPTIAVGAQPNIVAAPRMFFVEVKASF